MASLYTLVNLAEVAQVFPLVLLKIQPSTVEPDAWPIVTSAVTIRTADFWFNELTGSPWR